MQRAGRIQKALNQNFKLQSLEVIDESSNHRVPAGSESHFRVRLVSEDFKGLSAVKRHQLVYKALSSELSSGLHALAIEALSPDEVAPNISSPPCSHA